ncbi:MULTISPECIES: hypothetical protein [Bacillus subtilis group]|uniref:hypothetical protein n=1 Tax=Bacillus TaxID=1386 RepID=UPI000E5280C0|nr:MULTISPECIES: hypothetical protein [Bacillus subtilis group]MBT3123292.1 hypothetical protein [Bacillus inaquosorum]MCB5337241.1 hypothetical protein [Bacillus amyloliquefaciens]MCF7615560.1 hypothetical protein [Bacillus subtilis]QWK35220.1 hypothetical protein KM843_20150 [Bacillus velezensis]RHL12209.1 hypothetical protein DW032_18370 [Bacillus licheniformis]
MEENRKEVYVLIDENLGGLSREFFEVTKEAHKGDLIIYPEGAYYFSHGPFYRVSKVFEDGKVAVEDDPDHIVELLGYKVLEPTNVIHLKDQRYKMVDRKALVGDNVVICEVHEDMGTIDELGKTAKVTEVRDSGHIDTAELGVVLRSEYRVLDLLG